MLEERRITFVVLSGRLGYYCLGAVVSMSLFLFMCYCVTKSCSYLSDLTYHFSKLSDTIFFEINFLANALSLSWSLLCFRRLTLSLYLSVSLFLPFLLSFSFSITLPI